MEEEKENTEEAKPEEEKIGEEVGVITHYFNKIGVGVVKIEKGSLKVGDKIRIKGATTDFEQTVESMQKEHESIEEAKEGESVGLKVKEHVREHDRVYKVE